MVKVAQSYLEPLREAEVDTLILGCTHYPLLTGVIQYVMGEAVVLVSSAEATASEVFARLRDDGLLDRSGERGIHRFISSSKEEIFSELGARFLGPEFGKVEHMPWIDRAGRV